MNYVKVPEAQGKTAVGKSRNTDDAGVLRVGGTRVRLETIINAFNSDSSAEEVLLKYPSLNLTDIYAVITYSLWSREEVEVYLEERRRSVPAHQR